LRLYIFFSQHKKKKKKKEEEGAQATNKATKGKPTSALERARVGAGRPTQAQGRLVHPTVGWFGALAAHAGPNTPPPNQSHSPRLHARLLQTIFIFFKKKIE
jgi:hypothetical protein